MNTFKARLERFDQMGEKTGWTFIHIPPKVSEKLSPGNKKAYRVKGLLDAFPIQGVSLIPMGDGAFIMAINAQMRKGIRKQKGADITVKLELDESPMVICPEFIEALEFEPRGLEYFNSLPKGHQRYFSKWIEDARTEPTRIKRIAMAVNYLAKEMKFNEMLRAEKAKKD
jgi:hypothetical protein